MCLPWQESHVPCCPGAQPGWELCTPTFKQNFSPEWKFRRWANWGSFLSFLTTHHFSFIYLNPDSGRFGKDRSEILRVWVLL